MWRRRRLNPVTLMKSMMRTSEDVSSVLSVISSLISQTMTSSPLRLKMMKRSMILRPRSSAARLALFLSSLYIRFLLRLPASSASVRGWSSEAKAEEEAAHHTHGRFPQDAAIINPLQALCKLIARVLLKEWKKMNQVDKMAIVATMAKMAFQIDSL